VETPFVTPSVCYFLQSEGVEPSNALQKKHAKASRKSRAPNYGQPAAAPPRHRRRSPAAARRSSVGRLLRVRLRRCHVIRRGMGVPAQLAVAPVARVTE
jgi:hypothetical protein